MPMLIDQYIHTCENDVQYFDTPSSDCDFLSPSLLLVSRVFIHYFSQDPVPPLPLP